MPAPLEPRTSRALAGPQVEIDVVPGKSVSAPRPARRDETPRNRTPDPPAPAPTPVGRHRLVDQSVGQLPRAAHSAIRARPHARTCRHADAASGTEAEHLEDRDRHEHRDGEPGSPATAPYGGERRGPPGERRDRRRAPARSDTSAAVPACASARRVIARRTAASASRMRSRATSSAPKAIQHVEAGEVVERSHRPAPARNGARGELGPGLRRPTPTGARRHAGSDGGRRAG